MSGFTSFLWSWWGVVLGIVVLVGNSWALFLSDGKLSLELYINCSYWTKNWWGKYKNVPCVTHIQMLILQVYVDYIHLYFKVIFKYVTTASFVKTTSICHENIKNSVNLLLCDKWTCLLVRSLCCPLYWACLATFWPRFRQGRAPSVLTSFTAYVTYWVMWLRWRPVWWQISSILIWFWKRWVERSQYVLEWSHYNSLHCSRYVSPSMMREEEEDVEWWWCWGGWSWWWCDDNDKNNVDDDYDNCDDDNDDIVSDLHNMNIYDNNDDDVMVMVVMMMVMVMVMMMIMIRMMKMVMMLMMMMGWGWWWWWWWWW